jgi:tetratricopeptide (TPR) repeat protein
MREIVFDTETTGLSPANGDRLVEIGCVELVNRVETGRTFHSYFNPGRAMPSEAEAVHGLSERFLADKPGDAAMRFQKGVMLSELGRSDEAIDVFTRLTQDFPGLPEPYNNLGVLLSARGEYEKARVALEAAVRNNPDYAVAHENLGDVHVAIAGQEYARAIALAPADTTGRPKLELIRELLSRAARGTVRAASGVPAS